MKNKHFIVVAILLLQCVAQSQSKTVPPEATKINYVARIPFSVVKYRPKNGMTRFYGLTTIQGQKMALHLYDVGPAPRIDEYTIKHNSRLDVFAIQRRNKATVYRRLHSTALSRDVFSWTKPKLICEMLSCWLDPKKNARPFLMTRITTSGGGPGFHRYDSLLVFDKCLQDKPKVSVFGGSRVDEGFSEGDTDYRRGLDENGFLMPWSISFDRGTSTYTVYKWNGQTFKEIASQHDDSSDPFVYHWDGKKFVEEDLRKKQVAPASKTEK